MQGSTVMRQRHAETLAPEEPDELIAHVRVCGGAGWVTTGSTRKPRAIASVPASLRPLRAVHCGRSSGSAVLHPITTEWTGRWVHRQKGLLGRRETHTLHEPTEASCPEQGGHHGRRWGKGH